MQRYFALSDWIVPLIQIFSYLFKAYLLLAFEQAEAPGEAYVEVVYLREVVAEPDCVKANVFIPQREEFNPCPRI